MQEENHAQISASAFVLPLIVSVVSARQSATQPVHDAEQKHLELCRLPL